MEIIKMVMPKNMQKKVISKEIHKKGIDPQLIDLEAYVDGRLSLKENMDDIMNNIDFMVPIEEQAHFGTKSEKKIALFEKAQLKHKLRSERAIRMDDQKVNKNNFDMSDLNKDVYDKWEKNPGHYDINGVDNDLPIS